ASTFPPAFLLPFLTCWLAKTAPPLKIHIMYIFVLPPTADPGFDAGIRLEQASEKKRDWKRRPGLQEQRGGGCPDRRRQHRATPAVCRITEHGDIDEREGGRGYAHVFAQQQKRENAAHHATARPPFRHADVVI